MWLTVLRAEHTVNHMVDNNAAPVEVLLHVGMYSLTAHLTEGVEMDIVPWFERVRTPR